MKKDTLLLNQSLKKTLRSTYRENRSHLPFARREEAARKAFAFLKDFSKKKNAVLSFANTPFELDLSGFNRFLCAADKLLLPKVCEQQISSYKVVDLENHLSPGFCSLLEPNENCEEITLEKIDCVLVPGLIFDQQGNRLGYGKGYYDRFLSSLPKSCVTIGIGFREQLIDSLPTDSWDVKLDEIQLF